MPSPSMKKLFGYKAEKLLKKTLNNFGDVFLSSLDEEKPIQSFMERIKDEAATESLKAFVLDILYGKYTWEEINWQDHLKLVIKIYGFVFTLRLLAYIFRRCREAVIFDLKMEAIKRRKLENVFIKSADQQEWAVIVGAGDEFGLEVAKILKDIQMNIILVSDKFGADSDEILSPQTSIEKDLRNEDGEPGQDKKLGNGDKETSQTGQAGEDEIIDSLDQKVIRLKHCFTTESPYAFFQKIEKVFKTNQIEAVKFALFNNHGRINFRRFHQTNLEEVREEITRNFAGPLYSSLFLKDNIEDKSAHSASGVVFMSSFLSRGFFPGFQARPFCQSMVNSLANYFSVRFKRRYITALSYRGFMKSSKGLGIGLITPRNAADFVLKNFGLRFISGVCKNHERMRLYWGSLGMVYWLNNWFFLKFILSKEAMIHESIKDDPEDSQGMAEAGAGDLPKSHSQGTGSMTKSSFFGMRNSSIFLSNN